jgi:hypothetical protein
MSSQSLNSSYDEATGVGNTGGFTTTVGDYKFPLRDASDFIRMKKERLVRVEFSGTPTPPPYDISQSNSYRLIYNFGRIRCGTCSSGPFLKTAVGQSP